jgi:hypothetical protein
MNMTDSTPNAQRRTSKAQPSVELHIDELVLAPFRLERLQSAAQLEHGALTLRRAQASYGDV